MEISLFVKKKIFLLTQSLQLKNFLLTKILKMNNCIVQKEVFNLSLVLIKLFPGFNATIILEQIFKYLEVEGFSEKIISESDYDTTVGTYFRGILHSFNGRPSTIYRSRNMTVKKYYRLGKLHRENNLPAIIYKCGTERETYYYIDGKLHRENDEPAYIMDGRINGKIRKWYYRGKLHREGDKPATITTSRKEYYINGNLHREGDKPAVVDYNVKEYYINGKLHREGDKPAIIYTDDRTEYYVNGKLHREGDLPASIDKCGQRKRWFLNGLLHRENDLPAIIDQRFIHNEFSGLCLGWLINGKYHRSNGKPSYINPREMIFYNNGLIHRSDGPAILRSDKVSYFVNGEFRLMMSFDEYKTVASDEDLRFIHSWNYFKFCSGGFIYSPVNHFLPTGENLFDLYYPVARK